MADLKTEKSKLLPILHENQRIVKENNQLHFEMIKCEEEAERAKLELQHEQLKWQSRIDDLNFQISEKDQIIKVYKSGREVNGERFGGNRDEMEGQILKDFSGESLDDAGVMIQELEHTRRQYIEELQQADERIASMSQELQKFENMKIEYEDTIKHCKESIQARDKEISRLNILQTEGSNIDVVTHSYNLKISKETIEKLNSQIDFLSSENTKLSADLEIKNEILSTADKYKTDRFKMSKRYNNLKAKNKILKEQLQKEGTTLDLQNTEFGATAMQDLTSRQDFEFEQQKRAQAENDLKTLQKQIKKLQKSLKIAQDQAQKYEEDLSSVTQNLQKKTKQYEDSKRSSESFQKQIQKLKSDKKKIKQELETYKTKYQKMEQDFQQDLSIKETTKMENGLTQEEKGILQERFARVETELVETQKLYANTKTQLDAISREKENIECELHEFKQKASASKSQYDSNFMTLNSTPMQSEAIHSEIKQKRLERIHEESRNIEELLEAKNLKIQNLVRDLKATKEELGSANDSNQIMRNEHKILSDELSHALSNLESQTKKAQQLEEENEQYKLLKSKFGAIEEQVSSVISLKEEMDKENAKNLAQIKNLESILEIKERVIEDTDKKYQEVWAKLSDSGKRKENNTSSSLMQQYKQEIQDKQSLIETQKTTEIQNSTKIDELQIEIKKLKAETVLRKERFETLEAEKTKIEHQLEQAQNKVVTLEQKLTYEEKICQLTEKQKSSTTTQVEDLKDKVSSLTDEKSILQGKIIDSKIKIEELQLSLSKQCDETEKLQSLIKTLEVSKEELAKKLQSLNRERNTEERDKSDFIAEIDQLKSKLVSKEKEINEMRENVIDLDKRNDMLQNQLDHKSEELFETQNALKSQSKEFSETKHQFSFATSKEETYEKKLQEREKEIEELKKQIDRVNDKIQKYQQKESKHANNATQLASEIEVMRKENQEFKEQIAKLTEEKEYFRKVFLDSEVKIKQLDQHLRALE